MCSSGIVYKEPVFLQIVVDVVTVITMKPKPPFPPPTHEGEVEEEKEEEEKRADRLWKLFESACVQTRVFFVSLVESGEPGKMSWKKQMRPESCVLLLLRVYAWISRPGFRVKELLV